MPPDLISGRDIELIVIEIFSLLASGAWATKSDGSINLVPLGINLVPLGMFVLLAVLSFLLAWLDRRSRGGISVPREE